MSVETKIAKFASFGAPLITVFVLTGNVSDPVNSPKFFLLGALAIGLLFVSIFQGSAAKTRKLQVTLYIFLIFFVFWSLIVAFKSESPLSQNLYGVYGRNTGLLTYFFLAIWAFSLSRFKDRKSINLVVWGFVAAGVINVVYCLWVVFLGDFIGWNNPYKAILGTFGNPNFISSFLGIFFSVSLAFVLGKNHTLRLVFGLSLPITVFLLTQADSIQGIVIMFAGTWLVSFYYLLVSIKHSLLTYLYFAIGIFIGILGILGASGFGPLDKVVAQPTIAFRIQYWYAAWKMGISNPYFGVGMDSYGDWFRRERGEEALISPGVNVVTNAAHNVYLDLFAYGGFPLLLSYIAISLIGLSSIFIVLRRREQFDPIFASVGVIWVLYQLQSLISINQIGLAIWGWVSTGLLVSYAGLGGVKIDKNYISKEKINFRLLDPGIRIFMGIVIGALIAIPPLSADMKWMKALKTQNVEILKNSLKGDYLSPVNSKILAQAALTLERSGLQDLAIRYARKGVNFNPNYDDAWETLYYMKESTQSEKRIAREKLILLDPLNPEWKKLP